MNMATTFYRVNCEACGTVELEGSWPRSVSARIARCPKCNERRTFRTNAANRVRVTETTTHECDTACTHAKGDTCACECGGHCHGLGECDPSRHRSKFAA